jgi:hypothetical protein
LTADLKTDLESVPGIGPVASGHLTAAGITTPHQLIGKFLSFKTKVSVRCGAVRCGARCQARPGARSLSYVSQPTACLQDATVQSMCDTMIAFLGSVGITSHRTTVVQAVAEKVRVCPFRIWVVSVC